MTRSALGVPEPAGVCRAVGVCAACPPSLTALRSPEQTFRIGLGVIRTLRRLLVHEIVCKTVLGIDLGNNRTRSLVTDRLVTIVTSEEVEGMPLYLDVHNKVDGLTAAGAAEDHRKDLAVQHKYGVKYLRYWFDEGTGKVFCLVEAPSKEAATAVHREAHGSVADEIVEVKEGS